MSVKFDEFLQEQLLDSEFKNEYEALQPERAIIQAIIDARQRSGLTQKELSERTGIAQEILANWNAETPTRLFVPCNDWLQVWVCLFT